MAIDLKHINSENCGYQSFWLKWVKLTSLFNRLEFVLESGDLKHTKSGKCVKPIGAASDGAVLGLYSSCGGHQFSFTAGGSLQHVGSKKCVNTKSGVSKVNFSRKRIFGETSCFFIVTQETNEVNSIYL